MRSSKKCGNISGKAFATAIQNEDLQAIENVFAASVAVSHYPVFSRVFIRSDQFGAFPKHKGMLFGVLFDDDELQDSLAGKVRSPKEFVSLKTASQNSRVIDLLTADNPQIGVTDMRKSISVMFKRMPGDQCLIFEVALTEMALPPK